MGTEFKSVNGKSGSCGVGSCEAESELHDTATLFSRFLSGIVKFCVQNVISAYILYIQGSDILTTAGLNNLLGPSVSNVN